MRRRRWAIALAALLALALVVPVPWLHVVSENPPGSAWRLNGRLEVGGHVVDPPGRWSWLAVGRPQLVGEVLWERLTDSTSTARDLRVGSVVHRPALSEPAAVAVGLRHAGRDVPLGLLVEATSPRLEGLPESALITSLNGVALTDRQAWERASGRASETAPARESVGAGPRAESAEVPPAPTTTFRTAGGLEFTAPGPGLPYDVVRTLDLAPADLDAGISFGITQWLPVDWFRKLSLGSSHGAMVALVTYADASGLDLAQGRHIAGTGGILGDGTVTRIGGLSAKARAAKRAGADVLLVPASQVGELDDVDLRGVQVVPWRTLSDAIAWLSQPIT